MRFLQNMDSYLTMDDHFPAGFYYTAGHPTIYHPAPTPWGLPLRAMISANITNLVFAGRNISVTHAALSSSRVMATCAVLGQALGTAAAQAVNTDTDIRSIDVAVLQDSLMQDDCFIPFHHRKVSELCLNAKCNSDTIRNGFERGNDNLWIGSEGDFVEYNFGKDVCINDIRMVFDSDLNRDYYNMPCCYLLDEKKFKLPDTLIKSYKIVGENANGDKFEISTDTNHQRFVKHSVNWKVSKIRLIPLETHGCKEFRIFDFEAR